jgi:hypothetical protein
MPRTYVTFGDIAGKLHILRIEGTRCARKGQLQRRQAPRSARPSGQYEQVGVRSLRRLPETECFSPARALRKTIPIVMMGVGDPVGAGLASSLAWPGGNITGKAAAPHIALSISSGRCFDTASRAVFLSEREVTPRSWDPTKVH